jgi:hypothetical protein
MLQCCDILRFPAALAARRAPYELKQLAGRNADAADLSGENIARVNRME